MSETESAEFMRRTRHTSACARFENSAVTCCFVPLKPSFLSDSCTRWRITGTSSRTRGATTFSALHCLFFACTLVQFSPHVETRKKRAEPYPYGDRHREQQTRYDGDQDDRRRIWGGAFGERKGDREVQEFIGQCLDGRGDEGSSGIRSLQRARTSSKMV